MVKVRGKGGINVGIPFVHESANTNTNNYELFVRGCCKKCEQNVLFLSISKEFLSCDWMCAKKSSVWLFHSRDGSNSLPHQISAGYPADIRDVTDGICKLRKTYNYRK